MYQVEKDQQMTDSKGTSADSKCISPTDPKGTSPTDPKSSGVTGDSGVERYLSSIFAHAVYACPPTVKAEDNWISALAELTALDGYGGALAVQSTYEAWARPMSHVLHGGLRRFIEILPKLPEIQAGACAAHRDLHKYAHENEACKECQQRHKRFATRHRWIINGLRTASQQRVTALEKERIDLRDACVAALQSKHSTAPDIATMHRLLDSRLTDPPKWSAERMARGRAIQVRCPDLTEEQIQLICEKYWNTLGVE